jgi:hypothetical protein
MDAPMDKVLLLLSTIRRALESGTAHFAWMAGRVDAPNSKPPDGQIPD